MKKKLKTKNLTLALGESTNTHRMLCEKEIEYEQNGANIEFLLEETGVVTHEEHDTHVLSPGKYSKVQQTEINPLDLSLNAVFD